jgi:hypothetical protein
MEKALGGDVLIEAAIEMEHAGRYLKYVKHLMVTLYFC